MMSMSILERTHAFEGYRFKCTRQSMNHLLRLLIRLRNPQLTGVDHSELLNERKMCELFQVKGIQFAKDVAVKLALAQRSHLNTREISTTLAEQSTETG